MGILNYFIFPLMMVALIACSGSDQGGALDGAVDGAGDAGDGEDGGGGDTGLDEDCGIAVAANLIACTRNPGLLVDTLGAALRNKARVSFRSGLIRLARGEESFDSDWIAKLELGAQAEEASPSGPGRFTRSILQGTPDDGILQWEFRQSFQATGTSFELVFRAQFEIAGGQAIQPLLQLDERALDNPNTAWSLQLLSDGGGAPREFTSCGLAAGDCQAFELEVEGGDALRFQSCRHCPDDWMCKADWAVLRRAVFTSQDGQTTVEDPLLLQQTMAHHNWGTDILIAFREPLGATHGLYLHAMDEFYPGPDSFAEIHYLDADYSSYQSRAVTRFEAVEDRSPVWGWISVYELNDAFVNADWGWTGGVRAYLAEAPHQRRALEHEKPGLAGSVVATSGHCTLYECEWQDRWRCDPPCDTERQDCVSEGEEDRCVDLPRAWNAGAITVSLASSSIELLPDELGRYSTDDAPGDLFGAGDPIGISAAGGELAPFALSTQGVAHLELTDPNVSLTAGQAASVSWTPADPGSRVQIMLFSGPHHPAPPVAAILCDAPDEDGQVEISAELVDGFLERTWVANWGSQALRYRESTSDTLAGSIRLRAGSMQQLSLSWR